MECSLLYTPTEKFIKPSDAIPTENSDIEIDEFDIISDLDVPQSSKNISAKRSR